MSEGREGHPSLAMSEGAHVLLRQQLRLAVQHLRHTLPPAHHEQLARDAHGEAPRL